MLIRTFKATDESQVIALWRACNLVRPWNDPHQDIRRKVAEQPELLLVGEQDSAIVATVMAGYEGHRGWINYLAVAPPLRRTGLGRAIMDAAEALLRDRGCPKINLLVRPTNTAVVGIYQRLGYGVEDCILMGKRLLVA